MVTELKSRTYRTTHELPANVTLPERADDALYPVTLGVSEDGRVAVAYWDGGCWAGSTYAEIDPGLTPEVVALYRRVH